MQDALPNLALLQAGDDAAWDEAFERLNPVAWAAAKRFLNSPEDIEDAATDALAELPRAIGQFKELRELAPFVFRVARNKAIDLARRKNALIRSEKLTVRWEDLPVPEQEQCAAGPALMDQLAPAEIAELLTLLHESMNSLSEDCRILLWEKFEGFTFQQLSDRHGLPLGTVAAKIARSLEKIRERLRASPKLLQALRDFLR